MDRKLIPSPLAGHISAIPSKSDAHRVLICAALSDSSTIVKSPGLSQDIIATINCLRALGAEISQFGDCLQINPVRSVPPSTMLDCCESGSTLRFLLPVAAALCQSVSFTGSGRLPDRPLTELTDAMCQHGCTVSSSSIPLTATKMASGGLFSLPGNISSQYISGLLMAAPLLDQDVEIRLTTHLESANYVDMTISTMHQFGIEVKRSGNSFFVRSGQHYRSPGQAVIDGDWSNSAFWLVAGAVAGPICCSGLSMDSAQGDRQIISLLESAGASIYYNSSKVAVLRGPLKAQQINAAHIPDLVPILAVLASVSSGITEIQNVSRLQLKESDRFHSVPALLTALGADIRIEGDSFLIRGKSKLSGGSVSSCNDHRLAMAAAIAACVCTAPVILRDSQAVEKSYPNFWTDYKSLGGIADVI